MYLLVVPGFRGRSPCYRGISPAHGGGAGHASDGGGTKRGPGLPTTRPGSAGTAPLRNPMYSRPVEVPSTCPRSTSAPIVHRSPVRSPYVSRRSGPMRTTVNLRAPTLPSKVMTPPVRARTGPVTATVTPRCPAHLSHAGTTYGRTTGPGRTACGGGTMQNRTSSARRNSTPRMCGARCRSGHSC